MIERRAYKGILHEEILGCGGRVQRRRNNPLYHGFAEGRKSSSPGIELSWADAKETIRRDLRLFSNGFFGVTVLRATARFWQPDYQNRTAARVGPKGDESLLVFPLTDSTTEVLFQHCVASV
jgi:hypothetical protein